MMSVLFLRDIRPGTNDYAFTRTYTLEGVVVVFRCHWHDRSGRWQVEMLSPSGEVLAFGQASPGGVFVHDPRDESQPPGTFVWGSGPEPYTRQDLGDAVRLYYVESTESEIDPSQILKAVSP